MWGHLRDQRLMEALEGVADERTRAHLAACAGCRARLEESREGVRLAQEAEVPEPSPLYWEAFRRQVGRRLEDAAAPTRRRFGLAPALAAAAGLLVATSLVLLSSRRPQSTPEPTLPAWSALPPSQGDVGFEVLRGLAPAAEDLGGATGCTGVAECVAVLSEEESRAVAEALRNELEGRSL